MYTDYVISKHPFLSCFLFLLPIKKYFNNNRRFYLYRALQFSEHFHMYYFHFTLNTTLSSVYVSRHDHSHGLYMGRQLQNHEGSGVIWLKINISYTSSQEITGLSPGVSTFAKNFENNIKL